eukprot:g3095.t1
MQNIPPPPAGSVSQGLPRSGKTLGVAPEPPRAADPYAMSGEERAKYESIFPMYDSDRDGFVTGVEAVELFSKSRLPREQLRQIWQLADADGDSRLSRAEFCVGMHLIVCVSKKGLPCPATRPPSLFGSGSTLGGVANSAQVLGGSPAKPVPQSPTVRPAPAMRPPSSPSSAMLPLGAVTSSSEDAFSAFSALAVDLPAKDPTALPKEAEAGTPAPEQDTPAAEHPKNTPTRSPTSTNVSENGSPGGDPQPPSAGGMQELVVASSALLAVARDVSTAHNQVLTAQSASVQSVKALVEQLQIEKVSLGSVFEAGRVEHAENERQLREMSNEIKSLTADLATLRSKLQEQQKDAADLRARAAQSSIERGTLVSEVKACDSMLNAQTEENAFLRRAVLGENGTSKETSSSPQPLGAGSEEESPALAEQVKEPLQVSSEPKVDTPAEPVMPAKTPPPPPPQPGMVAQSTGIEDPFAEVVGEDSDAPAVESQVNNYEKEEGGFDAFSGNGFENGTDPFAIDGFSENGLGEVASDPFTTTDAVFTNATAAADGFDAFPSSAAQQFDAFGQ